MNVPIVTTDLAALSAEERPAAIQNALLQEAGRPFDLAAAPLLRLQTITLGDDRHVVQFVVHHIVADGLSLGVLRRELVALYAAACTGEKADLPALPLQYTDFALWQRAHLQGETLQRLQSYWIGRLDRVAAVRWPPDRRRAGDSFEYQGGQQSVTVSRETADRLRAMARAESSTLYMVLLAAFKAVIVHATRQHDVVVLGEAAGRPQPEFEPLVGFFVNMLALRTDLSGTPTFTEIIRRVRETCIEADEHQAMPFDRLVSALHLPREADGTPLTGINFSMQDHPGRLPRLRDRIIDVFNGKSRFELSLIALVDESITVVVEYAEDLYEAASMQALLAAYTKLLDVVSERPEERLPVLVQLIDREAASARSRDARRAEDHARSSLTSTKRRQVGSAPVH